MNPKKADECNKHMEPSANPDQHVIRIPKCWEEHEPPPGYFDPVDPCKKQPSMFLDFRGLLDYAKSVHKDITELSYDEVCPFLGNRKE